MNTAAACTSNCPSTCSSTPFAEPVLPAHPVAQFWHAIAARWAAHLERRRHAHDFDFAADLSADMLRDIGAPEEMVASAQERRESREQRVLDLRQWRGG